MFYIFLIIKFHFLVIIRNHKVIMKYNYQLMIHACDVIWLLPMGHNMRNYFCKFWCYTMQYYYVGIWLPPTMNTMKKNNCKRKNSWTLSKAAKFSPYNHIQVSNFGEYIWSKEKNSLINDPATFNRRGHNMCVCAR